MYHEQSTVTTVQQLPTSYQNAVAEVDYYGTQVGYFEYNKLNLSKLILLKTVSEALHSNNEKSSNLLQPLVTQLVAPIKIKIHSCYLYRAFFWWKTMALWMSSSDLMPRARGISTTWTARWMCPGGDIPPGASAVCAGWPGLGWKPLQCE